MHCRYRPHVMTYYFYHPSYGGVAGYRYFALRFRNNDFMDDLVNIRTYLYPTLLYILFVISGISSSHLGSVTGLVQLSLLIVSTDVLSRQLHNISFSTLLIALKARILLNPIVLALITYGLSRGLMFAASAGALSCAIGASSARSTGRCSTLLAGGSLLLAIALMIRPAALLIMGAWIVADGFAIIFDHNLRGRRLAIAFGFISGIALFLLIVGLPQIAYSIAHYKTSSLLPVCDIGAMQLALGTVTLKYDTLIVNNQVAAPLIYNSFIVAGANLRSASEFYFSLSLRPAATIITKLILGFSLTDIFLSPSEMLRYALPLSYCTFAQSVAGALAGLPEIGVFVETRHSPVFRNSLQIPMVFLIALTLFTFAQNCLIARETRFTLIPQTILIVIALWCLLSADKHHGAAIARRLRTGLCVRFCSYAINFLCPSVRSRPHDLTPPAGIDHRY